MSALECEPSPLGLYWRVCRRHSGGVMRAAVVMGATAAMWLGVSSADGATVTIRANPNRGVVPANLELVYRAAAGERNRTVVQSGYIGSPWTVSDSGAVIEPGPWCTTVDSHTARCLPPASDDPLEGLVAADAQLGDLDDEVRLVQPDGFGRFALFADGGAGNDVLSAPEGGGALEGGPGDDRLLGGQVVGYSIVLNGGGGRDELRGGSGDDTLSDGDLDGASGDAAPGPDLIDGGRGGDDTISYRGRTGPVFVDLATLAPAGARGERDTVRNVESIIGGQGDDRLAGDRRSNELDGRAGRDTLIGRGSDDVFRNARGPISCGEGDHDLVLSPRATDYLKPGCETIAPSNGEGFPAYPTRVRAGAVRYRIRCPLDEEEFFRYRCSGSVTIKRVAAPHYRLAAGRSPRGRWEDRPVDVALTPAGRRLASSRHGILARVTLSIHSAESYAPAFPALRWTIRLKVPR